MTEIFDTILKNGHVVTPWGTVTADIAVRGSKIAGIGNYKTASARDIVDCTNLHVLPGIIDTHVHFREPGLTHKEDLQTGTLSALFGGVTTIFEMPNTDPLTVSGPALADKLLRAEGRAFCDYAFYIGGCAENAHLLPVLEKFQGCSGVKVFMGSSTGALLASDDETILKIMQSGTRRLCLHAEDDTRLAQRKHIAENGSDVRNHPIWRDAETALIAVKRAIGLAKTCGRKLHFLHTTSADEMAFLADHKDIATVETTPQHLTLSAPECYERMGTRAQMNPPIRTREHTDALWRAIADGTVDTLGSDHAPHTLDEKSQPYPKSPSGMPGVQTMLTVMLDHVHHGKLSLERLVDLLCHGPQRVYGIAGKGRIAAGYDADFAIVDLKATQTIADRQMKSKCGWTPYDGMRVTGRITGTMLRGRMAVWEDELILKKPAGESVRFTDTLIPLGDVAEKNIPVCGAAACC